MDKIENKICQNCKKEFTIESDDFNFYEKIKVPPPTFCPECRMIRRMVWRNEHNLFKKKDIRTGDLVFSSFHEESEVKIYSNDYWWSDKWDSCDYGFDYDFSKPFFEQLHRLFKEVPLPARVNLRDVNSPYSNNASDLKNCYLCFNCITGEDCLYGIHFNKMRNCVNFSTCSTSEECCNVFNITDCYTTFMTDDSASCVDVFYSFDCRNCQNCIGCVGLRNKQYCIFNKQYTKEEYFLKKEELKLGSFSSGKKIKDILSNLILKHPRKYMHTMKSINVSGDYVFGSKNVINSFTSYHGYDVKYSQDIRNTKDAYDVLVANFTEGSLYENSICGLQSSQVKFSVECYPSCLNIEYCLFCTSSSNIFGCVGLRNKQYCIFNRQYTKEKYFEMVEKIKKHMYEMPYIDGKGNIYKYGEFFPPEFSPFAYNDTIAQEYFPLDRERAQEKKYQWRDLEKRIHQITLLNKDIVDDIRDVSDTILDENIECEDKEACTHNCSKVFKIIQPELSFYRKNNIPLPRKCPNCRHYERIQTRNPLKLWHRKCMHEGCNNEFETSYSPDRPEIIYCEKCYQQEVY
ncbi:MAG: hypothetical protein R3B64_02530 [Candidatus Paceibacterota bacterium]